MAEIKTKKSDASVLKFLSGVSDKQKRDDCLELIKIFQEVTCEKAVMWGSSIIGFGEYHYKSEKSAQEGDWPLTGFSPRKDSITIYIMPGFDKYKSILKKLGKHKISGGSCIYIKKLAEIDKKILKKIIKDSVAKMKKKYKVK